MGDRSKDLIAGLTIIVAFAVSHVLPLPVTVVTSFILLFGILFHGHLLGARLFPKLPWIASIGFGAVLVLAIQSIIQTGFFYLGIPLSDIVLAWTSVIAMLLCQAAQLLTIHAEDEKKIVLPENKTLVLGAALIAVSLSLTSFVLLLSERHAVLESIRSPWLALPGTVVVAIGAAWMAVLIGAWLMQSRTVSAVQAGLALLATSGITPLLYRIGFGFDGFLHVASEKLLLTTGFLNPKPFYYIGQYTLVVWLTKLGNFSLTEVDRWLVPIASAILLPYAFAIAMGEKKRATWFAAFFFLPLSAFIATTPQAFAYVLGASALLLTLGFADEDVHPLAPFILAIWSVAIHPLAGIPLFCLCTMSWCIQNKNQSRMMQVLGGVFGFASAASIPILFLILSHLSHDGAVWDFSQVFNLAPWMTLMASLMPWIGNHFTLWASWGTLVAQSELFILLCAGIISAVIDRERHALWIAFTASGVLLIASSVILKAAGDFAFLIDYERGNYADRLLVLAAFAIFPASLPALGALFERIKKQAPLLAIASLFFLFAFASGQAYAALPRHDALVVGRGWSVGSDDLEAVRFIDRDAGKQPYGVLANQSVSAAAVSQLGFKRYVGDVFFYPIPTGGPLYDIYLKLTYGEPNLDLIKDAAKLTNSKIIYVVVNDYWWNADGLDESLRGLANENWTFGDETKGMGNVEHVYKFEVSR